MPTSKSKDDRNMNSISSNIALVGTIPVEYKQQSHTILVSISIPQSYPDLYPTTFVTTTSTMELHASKIIMACILNFT